MTSFIPVSVPLLVGNEKRYLEECISTGWISSEGPFVERFESGLAQCVGRRYGVAVANGSVAIEVAIAALGIGIGDEVILPTFTIISCAAAIVRAGAKPVVVDSDPVTWNMDVKQIEAKITPRTVAIMVVHTYGLPVDMDPVLSLAAKYKLAIIEDAAEAIGQTYRGRPCGSFGNISTFSFYANKHVTTGEGGMVLTDDSKLADRSRSYRNLSFIPTRRFVHEELGWNYRLSNLQAALGLAQLERLDMHTAIKRRMGKRYAELLLNVPGIEFPLGHADYADNVYWVYGIVLGDTIPIDAEGAMRRLGALNIGTRPFFWNMHEQPVFRKMGMFENEHYPVAERLARRGFYLPSGLALTDHQMDRTVECVREVLRDVTSAPAPDTVIT
jgi:perosamine synthetase